MTWNKNRKKKIQKISEQLLILQFIQQQLFSKAFDCSPVTIKRKISIEFWVNFGDMTRPGERFRKTAIFHKQEV